jgi:quercetin dioxygenase-like cupin family protein
MSSNATSTKSGPELYHWDRIEKEVMNPKFTRRVIHTDNMTIARLELAKGCEVPEHSHVNEQVSICEKGLMRFVISGQEYMVGSGEMIRIPPHVPHSVQVLEDTEAVDLFTPRREDWIRGDDAYLRK